MWTRVPAQGLRVKLPYHNYNVLLGYEEVRDEAPNAVVVDTTQAQYIVGTSTLLYDVNQ